MAGTWYGGTPPGITGTYYGGDPFGRRGAEVVLPGLDGPSLLGLDVQAGEEEDLFRVVIVAVPPGLTLFTVDEWSRVQADGSAGPHVGQKQGYKNGATYGPAVAFTILSGVVAATLSGGASLDEGGVNGGFGAGTPSGLGGGVTLGDGGAGGGLGSAAPAVLSGGLTLGNGSASGGFSDGSVAPPAFIPAARSIRTVRVAPRKVNSMGTAETVKAIDVAEEVPIDFVYTDELAGTGLTLVSASFEVDLRSGEDPNPQGILMGGYVMNGAADVVQQRVKGQVPSTSYGVRCVAIDSAGTPRTAVARLSVKRL